MARNACVEMIAKEVERWSGVSVRFERRRKHIMAHLSYRQNQRLVVVSTTASDHRSALNTLSDVRRQLRTIGAERMDGKNGR